MSEKPRRWFVAVPIVGEVLGHLGALPPMLKPMVAQDLHITIAFFGAVGEAAAHAGFAATHLQFTRQEVLLGAVECMGDGPRWSSTGSTGGTTTPSPPWTPRDRKSVV